MKRISKRMTLAVLAGTMLLAGATGVVFSHCEIPCGIYDDPMRLDMMAEHIMTLEKSMKQISMLSEAGDKNYNQLVRWISNKEHHADAFTEIVTQYFMTQRIKPTAQGNTPDYQEYVHKLTLLHQMMVTSMKCKQTTDLENITQLRSLLSEYRLAYLGPEAAHAHAEGDAHAH
jgi:nickel superoxide dismutase